MNPIQKHFLNLELRFARLKMKDRAFDEAMHHLERAHVLGQEDFVAHLVSHWLMFRVEVMRFSAGAACGQVIRMVLGMIGNTVGVLPTGNLGSSRVSMFARMEIPSELQPILRADGHFPA